MRSIRLSLVVYFLGLLGLALGVASILVYRSAQQTLKAKERATALLIEAKFNRRQDDERKRLDDGLRDQALALAGRVQISYRFSRLTNRSLHSLGTLTAAITPFGYVSAVPWLLQTNNIPSKDRGKPPPPIPPFAYEIWRSVLADITLTESDAELPEGQELGEYFQIDTNHYGLPYCSESLEDLEFPHPENFGGDNPVHLEPDDFQLAPGLLVRRVRVKVAGAPRVSSRLRGPVVQPPGSRTESPRPRREPPRLYFVLQVAADLRKLVDTLNTLRDERDRERELLADETSRALALLRNRLLAIASLTFAGTILGTCWLVWLGLLPLRRLSHAVSQVSPRNFTLHLESTSLPAELRPIADRLAETLELLRRAFAREKQATADISHELRTPLAALLTTLELALRKQRSSEQYREMIGDCRASAQQMNQIIERLLTLARLDAGVDRLRAQSVDVADLAEQCATIVRPLAEARGLHLSVHNECAGAGLSSGPSRLTTDPDKLREVLNNLLHNAIQYNRPDGRIDLVVARQDGRMQLEVRDTGIGIAPESREMIFERFYRADPSRTGDNMNAGLGLAIVKEYVGLMGGQISVESALGRGSTFRVQLPIQAPVSAA